MPDIWDDDQLLAVLKGALQAQQEVPAEFTEAGKNAYAWHNIDAELAQLTYDSLLDRAPSPSVRSETASIRALTFTSEHLTIEMEVNEDSLLCQLVPTDEATIELQTRAGVVATIEVDEVGCFPIRPIPASPFRLSCRTSDGAAVVTGWITLLSGPPGARDLMLSTGDSLTLPRMNAHRAVIIAAALTTAVAAALASTIAIYAGLALPRAVRHNLATASGTTLVRPGSSPARCPA